MATLRTLTVLAATLSLVACSSTGPSDPDIGTVTFAASLGVDLAAMAKTADGLYYRDQVVGDGATVTHGQQVAVHYTGWLPDGTQFDANGPADTPLTFTVGAGRVIPGFEEGVTGMKVGGRRQLVIPPSLAYGSQSAGPIPPNSYLVFVVEVLSAR